MAYHVESVGISIRPLFILLVFFFIIINSLVTFRFLFDDFKLGV
jgi:hypothetical protein